MLNKKILAAATKTCTMTNVCLVVVQRIGRWITPCMESGHFGRAEPSADATVDYASSLNN